jgi:bacterioferritin
MKGNEKIIERLNGRLSEELAAISQYMVHSSLCENWGYGKLHKAVEKRAIDEMKHAEMLINRILFLEGRPTVSVLAPISIGADVEAQIKNDWAGENGAISMYNQDIRNAADLGDHGTKQMLESILKDEEAHIDWLEVQQDQIKQMGLAGYLSQQME